MIRYDPDGNNWIGWVGAAIIVIGLGVGLGFIAGGPIGACIAVLQALNGVASAGMWTTLTAYAFIGASTAFAGAAIAAGGDTIIDIAQGSSVKSALNTAMEAGESAFWSTAGAAGFGALGGYASWRQQIGSKEQVGFMTKSQRKAQRDALKNANPDVDFTDLEINHIFGTWGNNRNVYVLQNKYDHRIGPNSFHAQYGFKTNGGPFHRANPSYINLWDFIIRYLNY